MIKFLICDAWSRANRVGYVVTRSSTIIFCLTRNRLLAVEHEQILNSCESQIAAAVSLMKWNTCSASCHSFPLLPCTSNRHSTLSSIVVCLDGLRSWISILVWVERGWHTEDTGRFASSRTCLSAVLPELQGSNLFLARFWQDYHYALMFQARCLFLTWFLLMQPAPTSEWSNQQLL